MLNFSLLFVFLSPEGANVVSIRCVLLFMSVEKIGMDGFSTGEFLVLSSSVRNNVDVLDYFFLLCHHAITTDTLPNYSLFTTGEAMTTCLL